MAKHLWGVSKPVASPPSGRSLITWAEIDATHQGTFNMPGGFAYSEGIHSQMSNGNIVMSGHVDNQDACVASPPGVLNGSNATQVGSFVDPTNDLHPTGWTPGDSNAFWIGGLLELDTRLYFTKHQWYNAGGTDWESQGYNTNYAGGAANAVGMWKATGTGVHSQRIGGQMGYAPEAVIADGYSYLAGQSAAAGAATGRFGPNMFAVKVNDGVGVGGDWLAKPLIWHDSGHSVADWWVGDRASGIWIETDNREGVLFFVTQQYGGDVWYGEANLESPPDPYGGYPGYHSNAYRLQAWLYDPADLMEVYNGTKNGWECVPYEITTLITIAKGSSSGSETFFSNLRGPAYQWNNLSLRDGRLIVMRKFFSGDSPGGHVFNLNAIT